MAWERGRLEREQWKYFDDLGACRYNAAWLSGGVRHEWLGISAGMPTIRGDQNGRLV